MNTDRKLILTCFDCNSDKIIVTMPTTGNNKDFVTLICEGCNAELRMEHIIKRLPKPTKP